MDQLKRKLEEQLEMAREYDFKELYLNVPINEARELERLLRDHYNK